MILSIDTCLGASSVAVLDGERVLAARSEPMTRGHQERIGIIARETAAEAGVAFSDLARIGVTVGPGSFTGLRVGLAFAKGLATALSIPCVGVNTLESLAYGQKGFVAAVLGEAGEPAQSKGFILCRSIAGEAEILTIAVDPVARRRGWGAALVEMAAGIATETRAEALFLEVAADNLAAIALYQSTGFSKVGLRKGYYPHPDGAKDALVMRRALNS
jgi:tRNA threonylcarbamoyl adenosine modification protein YeaZ